MARAGDLSCDKLCLNGEIVCACTVNSMKGKSMNQGLQQESFKTKDRNLREQEDTRQASCRKRAQ